MPLSPRKSMSAATTSPTPRTVLCVALLLLLSCCTGEGGIVPPKEPRPWPPRKGLPAWPPPYKRPAPKVATCPRDAVKLAACAGLLDIGGIAVGAAAAKGPCCSALGGLAGPEVAACLCIVAKESLLGIVTEWSVAIGPVLTACKVKVPHGFQCA